MTRNHAAEVVAARREQWRRHLETPNAFDRALEAYDALHPQGIAEAQEEWRRAKIAGDGDPAAIAVILVNDLRAKGIEIDAASAENLVRWWLALERRWDAQPRTPARLGSRAAFGVVTAATSYGISSADGTAASIAHSDHAHGTVPNPTTAGAGFTVPSGSLAISADSATLTIGSDVNLYRSAADGLATDDTFKAPKFGLGIQSGTVTVALSSAVTATAAVSFATAFAAAPKVVLVIEQAVSNAIVAKLVSGSVTVNGFSTIVVNVDGTARSGTFTVHWIAVSTA